MALIDIGEAITLQWHRARVRDTPAPLTYSLRQGVLKSPDISMVRSPSGRSRQVPHGPAPSLTSRASSVPSECRAGKYETIGRWLKRAAQHAEALTEVVVWDLPLTTGKVDAF